VVQSVSLTVNVTESSAVALAVYGLRQGWDEVQATWAERSTGVPWQSPGGGGVGDRGAAPLETVPAGSFSSVGERTVDFGQPMRCEVQRWVDDPGGNFGFMLVNAFSDGMNCASNEEAVPQVRPKLTVVYGPAGTPSPCIDGGVPDAGTRDAGTPKPDSGTADGGTADAGTAIDAGTTDAGGALSGTDAGSALRHNVRGFDCQSGPGLTPALLLGLLLCAGFAARRGRS
jgi:hypothetical protein